MTEAISDLPLSGVKVVELGHIVAGPSAGLMLADLGADVVKIEQPGVGDAARNMPNHGSTFFFLNRNKRSLALDLKSKQGVEVFERLILNADVVLDNFSPGQLDRWGIGFEWAEKIRPGIIYCSINGFLDGPYKSRPFLDELAQMAGGLAFMTGPAGQPLRAGASIVDIGAATYAVIGILAALMRKGASGKGGVVTAGLFETAVFWVGQHISRAQITGKVPEPLPVRAMGGQMGWGVYQIFQTRDSRQIFIALTSNRHWIRFCKALGLTDWIADPELETNSQRVAAHARIIPRLAELIAGMDFDDIAALLDGENLPYAPVNNPSDLLSDAHLNQGGHWLNVNPTGEMELKMPMMPVVIEGQSHRVVRQPPRLGEHTDEILEELGYTTSEIRSMKDDGLVQAEGGLLQVEKGSRSDEFSR